MFGSSLISTRLAPIDNTRHHSSTLSTIHLHSSSSNTFSNVLGSSFIPTRFPFLILIGFGNVLPVGTRVQTFRRKGPQNVSFLDLPNGSQIDRFWSDFGSSKRYLKWTPKRNHFRVHFWILFLRLSFPTGVPILHTCSTLLHFGYPPFPDDGSKKRSQKWTPPGPQKRSFWYPF